jgi:hypothetical protein
MTYLSTLPTAFELQVRKLGLDERTCVTSRALRLWCEKNKDRYYIPERLLARWGNECRAGSSTGVQRPCGLAL